MSRKLISIIIQSLIWWILLRVSMWYLGNHPAEKVGVMSTIDYVYQRVAGISKLFHWRTKWEVDELEQFKNSFHELQQVANSKACEVTLEANQVSKDTIVQVVQTLESTTAEEFNTNKTKYIAIFNRINEEINKNCKK